VPKDTKPEELSKMVMALPQKSSRSIRHPLNKVSKLPIKKGSDVISKVKGSSPRKPSQDSPEQDQSQHSSSLSSKGSDDQKDDNELKNILHKTRPDGEESDVSLSPINRSDNVTPSDVMLKTPCQNENVEAIDGECVSANYQTDRRSHQSIASLASVHSNQGSRGSVTSPHSRGGSQRSSQEIIRQPPNTSVNSSEYRERSRHSSANSNRESRENRIRSPHGSTNGDLTGHHIPDGTDYSLKADYPHQINMGLSREDLVGTQDIQLADSRGFSVIANDMERGMESRYQRVSEHRSMERNHSDSRVRSDIDSSGRQPSGDESDRNRSIAASKKYEIEEDEYSRSAHNKENISTLQKTLEDRALMPPPPVPSFHHNLVPHHKASDPPMLLTKQSLIKSSFAQQYLPPPATRKILSSKQYSQSQGDVFALKPDPPPIQDNVFSRTLSQSQGNIQDLSLPDLSQHSLVTPDQSRHRRILSEPMTDGKRLADDASMFRQPPAFHSTPFQRDATNMSETQFYELNQSEMSVMEGEKSTLDPNSRPGIIHQTFHAHKCEGFFFSAFESYYTFLTLFKMMMIALCN
jgi:hypothetical protein